MRARNIKPGLFKNEILGEADPIYSLLFIGLWTLADKEGRLENRPKRIRAELFPYRFELDVSTALAWLNHESFITVYEIGEKSYIQINNWKRHQSPHHKEAGSEIPSIKEAEKLKEKQELALAQAKHGSSMAQQECFNPPDSLIPDSLIPDSRVKQIRSESSDDESGPPDKKPEPENSPKKPSKYKFETHHHELAVRMSNPVVCRFPAQKIDLDQWADCVRKLQEIDGHAREEIIALWHWIVNHERSGFSWADNCRTPMKLREKKDGLSYFEIIRAQMRREQTHPAQSTKAQREAQRNAELDAWARGESTAEPYTGQTFEGETDD